MTQMKFSRCSDTEMVMRFRPDNTDGYDASELAELNAAWEWMLEDPNTYTDSVLDQWSATLMDEYDAGKRGDELIAWVYAP